MSWFFLLLATQFPSPHPSPSSLLVLLFLSASSRELGQTLWDQLEMMGYTLQWCSLLSWNNPGLPPGSSTALTSWSPEALQNVGSRNSQCTAQLSALFTGTDVSPNMWQLERQHLYSGNSKSCFLCFEMRSPSWPQPCAAEKSFFWASISPVEIRVCQNAPKPVLKPILGINPKTYQQVDQKGIQQC